MLPREILVREKEEAWHELSGCVRCLGTISGHIHLISWFYFGLFAFEGMSLFHQLEQGI
jgi:hypothetical protein